MRAETKHEFNSALIGMIMGDASITKDNKKMYLRHGGRQLDYVNEKVLFLEKYLTPNSLNENIDKLGYVYRYAYYNDPKIFHLAKNFYDKDRKKILKKNILNRITKISLAFFYMDDGNLTLIKDKKGVIKSRNIYLSTHNFTVEEVKCFQEVLKNKFNVDSYLTIEKNKYPRLRLNLENTIKFLEIVSPIVKNFKTMRYKLDLKYVNKKISFL